MKGPTRVLALVLDLLLFGHFAVRRLVLLGHVVPKITDNATDVPMVAFNVGRNLCLSMILGPEEHERVTRTRDVGFTSRRAFTGSQTSNRPFERRRSPTFLGCREDVCQMSRYWTLELLIQVVAVACSHKVVVSDTLDLGRGTKVKN